MSWIKPRLSPSLVISVIALFIALGGTAFALARNSVGARELKPIVVREHEQTVPPHTTLTVDIKCLSGQQVTGGGLEVLGHPQATDIEDSHPRSDGWEATVTNTGHAAESVDPEALCLKR